MKIHATIISSKLCLNLNPLEFSKLGDLVVPEKKGVGAMAPPANKATVITYEYQWIANVLHFKSCLL